MAIFASIVPMVLRFPNPKGHLIGGETDPNTAGGQKIFVQGK